jgi:hypothetical protein
MTAKSKAKTVKAWALMDKPSRKIWMVKMNKCSLIPFKSNSDSYVRVEIREVLRGEKVK